MAYTNIDDPSAYFQVALHSSANAATITNDGNSDLQPDLIWSKARGAAYNHGLYDSSRGVTKFLSSNATSAETTASSGFDLTSFNTDGFSTGNNQYNTICGGTTYVAWQWKVNGGTTVSLSNNINSVCQVNQDAGISIVKYTCTGGGNGQAVQHGLGLVPQVIITKNRTDTNYSDWITYHHSIGYTNFVKLNSTAASAGNSPYNGAAPTSSTYNVSIDLVEATKDYVSYVFAPIQGYSKFGKYVGNGNANGPFVYTGFKPAFIMWKRTSGTSDWVIWDNKRDPDNAVLKALYPSDAGAESTSSDGTGTSIDILSNGFKMRTNNAVMNGNGEDFIYMAFAENPFVTSTGIPTTAR